MGIMVSRNVSSSMVDVVYQHTWVILRQDELLLCLQQIWEMDSVKEKLGCLKIGPVVI